MKIHGKPIIDAAQKATFSITAADIKKATVKDPHSCAAAVAARREFDKVVAVHVYRQRTYIEFPDRVMRYQTSQPMRVETIAFDRGGRFEPGDYQLLPLAGRQRPSGRRQGSNAPGARDKGSKNRTPKRPRPPVHQITDGRVMAFDDTNLGLERGGGSGAKKKKR